MEAKLAVRLRSGQGYGNQLFAIMSVRALAEKYGRKFEIVSKDEWKAPWLRLKGGCARLLSQPHQYISRDLPVGYDALLYENLDVRQVNGQLSYGHHDQNLNEVLKSPANILLEGILQSPAYWSELIGQPNAIFENPKKALSEYPLDESVAIINIRGGEYVRSRRLLLPETYWRFGIQQLKDRGITEFLVITDDYKYATWLLNRKSIATLGKFHIPQLSMAQQISAIANAEFLLVSNSTFPLPTLMMFNPHASIFAPLYMAAYQLGFWQHEYNINRNITYLAGDSGKIVEGSSINYEPPAPLARRDIRQFGVGYLPSRQMRFLSILSQIKRRITGWNYEELL